MVAKVVVVWVKVYVVEVKMEVVWVDGVFMGTLFLISWTMLCGEACVSPSSSLRGVSINSLYSRPILLLSLNNFPLCVAPNIKVNA